MITLFCSQGDFCAIAFDLISMSLTIPVTRLIRAWNQRHWMEPMFRLLKHLLATEAYQARTEMPTTVILSCV
jgi:hypothetical protein